VCGFFFTYIKLGSQASCSSHHCSAPCAWPLTALEAGLLAGPPSWASAHAALGLASELRKRNQAAPWSPWSPRAPRSPRVTAKASTASRLAVLRAAKCALVDEAQRARHRADVVAVRRGARLCRASSWRVHAPRSRAAPGGQVQYSWTGTATALGCCPWLLRIRQPMHPLCRGKTMASV